MLASKQEATCELWTFSYDRKPCVTISRLLFTSCSCCTPQSSIWGLSPLHKNNYDNLPAIITTRYLVLKKVRRRSVVDLRGAYRSTLPESRAPSAYHCDMGLATAVQQTPYKTARSFDFPSTQHALGTAVTCCGMPWAIPQHTTICRNMPP